MLLFNRLVRFYITFWVRSSKVTVPAHLIVPQQKGRLGRHISLFVASVSDEEIFYNIDALDLYYKTFTGNISD